MEEESYYRQSEKYVEFQDTKKGDCKYEIDIEPSKSCIIICIICLFCTIVIAVGIALALVLPNKKIIAETTTEVVSTEDIFKTMGTTTQEAYVEMSDVDVQLNLVTQGDGTIITAVDFGFDVTEGPDDDDEITGTPAAELVSKAIAEFKSSSMAADVIKKENEVKLDDEEMSNNTNKNTTDDQGRQETSEGDNLKRSTTSFIPTTSKYHKLLYRVGVGLADMTGPFVELPFMGYKINSHKKSKGLHTRQYSRAFCFREANKTIIYIVAETYAVSHNIKVLLIKALQNVTSKGLRAHISINNIHIAATGTQSAPGCHIIDYLWGFGPLYGEECVRPMVEGMRKSVVRACLTTVPARLFYNKADVYYTQKNKDWYQQENYKRNIDYEFYATDFDYTLTQLRIENKFGNIIGILNWASVRAASLSYENMLASSDNLGYAALALEQKLNPGKLAGQAKVVTAFATSSVADLTSHIDGGRCINWRKKCDYHDECRWWIMWLVVNIYSHLGPCAIKLSSDAYFRHAASVGVRLVTAAQDALYTRGEELRGPINAMYTRLHGTKIFRVYNAFNNSFENGEAKLCPPYASWNYWLLPYDQSDQYYHNDRPNWDNSYEDNFWRKIVPTSSDRKCNDGDRDTAYHLYAKNDKDHTHLHPPDATISIINLGGFLVACIPAETTVMAGRRMIKVISKAMISKEHKPRVVVSGSTNEYVYFISTYEENHGRKEKEHYIQAFTTLGIRVLDVMLNHLDDLTKIVLEDVNSLYFEINSLGPAVETPVRIKNVLSSPPLNMPPQGTMFAQILNQPSPFVRRGGTLLVKFIASNPRTNLRHETSLFVFERRCNKQWIITMRDAEWDTKFHFGDMRGTVEWKISPNAVEGLYRIRYFAYANKKEFYAVTKNFNIPSGRPSLSFNRDGICEAIPNEWSVLLRYLDGKAYDAVLLLVKRKEK